MGTSDRLRRPLTCRDMVELVSDHLDGALGRRHRHRFEAHLAACAACAAYVGQMRATVAGLRRLDRRHLPRAVLAELRALAPARRRARGGPVATP